MRFWLYILFLGVTLAGYAKQDQEGTLPDAGEEPVEGLDSMYYLNDVVVTGTRTPLSLRQAATISRSSMWRLTLPSS